MKSVIITGAGSGIGRQCALTLLQKGHKVALAGRSEECLKETLNLAGEQAPNALVVPTDVTSEVSVSNLFSSVHDTFGRIDALFNNAGISLPPVPIEDLTLEQWRDTMETNVTGSFLCLREAVRWMKRQDPKGGRIINNGSISAHLPRPHALPYVTSKHAVTGLTRSLMLDGRKHNIACGQIDIGNASSDMTARMAGGVLQADGSTAAEPTIPTTRIAEALLYMIELPLEANVPFMTVMANQMPYAGRG